MSIGALTMKRKSPQGHAFPVWQHCPRRVKRMSLRALWGVLSQCCHTLTRPIVEKLVSEST